MAASSQVFLQVASQNVGIDVKTSQLILQVAFAPPATKAVRTTELSVQAAVVEKSVPATSNLALLVAYRTGHLGVLQNTAWTFDLDGHTFYVLTIGSQGTFVYDEITNEWSKWGTQGSTSWNMHNGLVWKNKIIATDQSQPIIYELDPTSFLDNGFKAQIRTVTGGLAMRQRTFIPNYAFRVTASLGEPDVAPTIPPTIPTVNLSYSDDQGKTYVNAGDIVITAGDNVQEIAWRSLGTMRPPQRVFRITDTGAIARIDGADAEVGEEGE